MLKHCFAIGVATVICAQAGASQSFASIKESSLRYAETTPQASEKNDAELVSIRWAIKSRDNVVLLRVPRAYLPLAGRSVSNDIRSNSQEPFRTAVAFDGLLPDLQPVARKGPQPREIQNDQFNGLIDSVFYGEKVRSEQEQLHTAAKIYFAGIANNYFRIKYRLQVVEKPERFGLKRVGAEHNLGLQTPVALSDFYYIGEDPERPDTFLLCADEAVPDDPPPGRRENPGCRMWFALPELSATIEVSFRRRHLHAWREIKSRISAFVISWR